MLYKTHYNKSVIDMVKKLAAKGSKRARKVFTIMKPNQLENREKLNKHE